jgi:leucyl aminopeptidase
MQITLETRPYATLEIDALVSYLFEDLDPVQGRIAEIDQATNGLLRKLSKSGELTGKPLEMTLVHAPAGLKATRLLLVGAGKRDKFDGSTLRKIAGAALRYLKARSVKNIAFLVREGEVTEDAAQAIAEGALAANFETDKYKTDKKNDKSVDTVLLAGYSDKERAAGEKGLGRGRIIADAQNFARDLVNEPSNKLTPKILAEKAEAMAKEAGLAVEILDEKKIADLKMGALLSVAQGGPEPPRVMVVTYTPANPKPGAPVIGLIGKAVTFDTGGVSIKPADGMEKMKYDMAGGATMLGAMRAIALLKPKVKVIGIVCATENMPSGKAQKPGDVQIAMSGKSIEIINTDAEGRLVLADGLFYARQLGCTHLVDAATLTGAVVVALGYANAGVFSNDDELYERFHQATEKAGEKMWRLPLDDEYKENIKSSIADIVNSGGRWGGAINAAMFLKEFAEDTPWIHLDIAGTAWMEDQKPWIAKGPSGIALRSLVEFVKGFAS